MYVGIYVCVYVCTYVCMYISRGGSRIFVKGGGGGILYRKAREPKKGLLYGLEVAHGPLAPP